MKPIECAREQDVLRAVSTSRPGRELVVDDDLQAHANACGACAEIVALATLLRQDRDEMLREVRVPAPGQVWWRAALRAHAEGARAARRPILWLEGIAAACVLGVGAAFGGTLWSAMRTGAAWLSAHGPRVELSGVDVDRVAGAIHAALPFALVVAACLLLTPIVVYIALSDE